MSSLPLLLEPKDLNDLRSESNILVIDLCQPQVYAQNHIPGAIFLDFRRLMSGQPPAAGEVPDLAVLSEVMSDIGLTDQHHVVAYDDEGGGWAGRLLWTLELLGHTKYSYLNGGLHAWAAEGLPLERSANRAVRSQYDASIKNPNCYINRQSIMQLLNHPNLAIWDARSPEEWAGIRVNAMKGGHIPGAANYEWTRGMDKNRSLRVRDLGEIESELEEIGITRDKTVITHCQSHHRSGFTWLLGKLLGFPNIIAYAGSWSDWGNAPETPVEKSN